MNPRLSPVSAKGEFSMARYRSSILSGEADSRSMHNWAVLIAFYCEKPDRAEHLETKIGW